MVRKRPAAGTDKIVDLTLSSDDPSEEQKRGPACDDADVEIVVDTAGPSRRIPIPVVRRAQGARTSSKDEDMEITGTIGQVRIDYTLSAIDTI